MWVVLVALVEPADLFVGLRRRARQRRPPATPASDARPPATRRRATRNYDSTRNQRAMPGVVHHVPCNNHGTSRSYLPRNTTKSVLSAVSGVLSCLAYWEFRPHLHVNFTAKPVARFAQFATTALSRSGPSGASPPVPCSLCSSRLPPARPAAAPVPRINDIGPKRCRGAALLPPVPVHVLSGARRRWAKLRGHTAITATRFLHFAPRALVPAFINAVRCVLGLFREVPSSVVVFGRVIAEQRPRRPRAWLHGHHTAV